MENFLSSWLILIGVFSMALASPGPDFVMAVRNSILYSRRTGIMTAVGFGLGVGVHAAYCLGGLALIIAKSVILFNVLKFIGAIYLFYIGIKALQSKGFESPALDGKSAPSISDLAALRSGFITNLLNPKATLFFLALFTQILNPNAAPPEQILYGTTCVLMTILWFSIVACVLTTPAIRRRFLSMSKWIDRACGGFFIALGCKLALTKM